MRRARSDSGRARGPDAGGGAARLTPGHVAEAGLTGTRKGASWWMLFLIWAILLSIPCWLLADVYHAGLRAITSAILGIALPKQRAGEVEVHATHVLGIFAAMCLASSRASWGRRLRAVAIGVPALMALELLTGIVALQTDILDQTGRGLPVWLMEFRDQALAAPPWLAAPVLWLLLVGPWQLPGSGTRQPPRGTR